MIKSNSLSFRDHDARVIYADGLYKRLIYHSYRNEYDHLMNSGLYSQLLNKNLIIEHKEIISPNDSSEIYKTLEPKQITFLSYPYEWTSSQWLKAIAAFIEINKISLKYGMILKDATPYNFYIEAGHAILFDTSSFMFYNDGDPWIAYRQFCEGFLGPISLIKFNLPYWSRLFIAQKAEIPLKFISKQLPLTSWFNTSVLINIHLHALFLNNKSVSIQKFNQLKRKNILTRNKIIHLLENIRLTTKRWENSSRLQSNWSLYYQNDILVDTYLDSKKQIIEDWLKKISPDSILDIGANTGLFSLMCSNYTNRVIALERDPESAEVLDRLIENSDNKAKIYTVNADITEPSPGIGYMNEETLPLIKRISSDLVMGLALIHHLCILNRLQFDQVAHMFKVFSKKYLIIEFISPEDSKVKLLRDSSPQINFDYSENKFIEQFSCFFSLIESQSTSIPTRKLYLYKIK